MIIALVFILGAIIGSFLNVVILRLPAGKRLNGRSGCVHCGHVLATWDLVPLLSYTFLGGKCRHCGKAISPRYFIVELATGLLFALDYLVLASGTGLLGSAAEWMQLVRLFFITSILVVIFTIDLEHMLILDKVLFFGITALAVLNLGVDLLSGSFGLHASLVTGILSGLALFFVFGALYYFSDGRWMGYGDAKFAFFLGFATPYPLIIPNFLLAFGIGAVAGIILILLGSKKMQSKIAFGTFLSISTLLTIYFGNSLIHSYLRLIGLA